jgi:oligoribonuclease (3'-5' exoribonuclease)
LNEPRYLYCWFDTEYTTLELERAKLLQVALVVSDDELRPIAPRPVDVPEELLRHDGFTAFLEPPPEEEISRHVLENYQPLLDKCAKYGRRADEIDAYLSLYLDAFPETRSEDIRTRPTLAGNSVYADYYLARKFLPRFLSHLNYRLFDVTTFKLEWLFHHRGEKFQKLGHADNIGKYYRGKDAVAGDKHDAYYDVQASMAELAYYRSRFDRVEDD